MDAIHMQARLDAFYHEMSAMITDVGVQDVAETDLDEILVILRERCLWKKENDTTLNAMGTGSKSRAQAFGELSLGNAQIQRILKEFYVGRPKLKMLVTETPKPETLEALPAFPIPVTPLVKRGPGRPPKVRDAELAPPESAPTPETE